ncbi:TPA: fimbrial protein [Serratia fonticola]
MSLFKGGLFSTLAVWSLLTLAENHAPEDGLFASLAVKGSIVESACTLEMVSEDQTVSLGGIASHVLNRFGDEAPPVTFHLLLRDCGRWGGVTRSATQGNNLVWGAGQQTVAITLRSKQQKGGLIAVTGQARGLALRLEDEQHRQLGPGMPSQAQLLMPGDNRLTFYVIPQRTAERLIPGSFYAVVNFQLNYD